MAFVSSAGVSRRGTWGFQRLGDTICGQRWGARVSTGTSGRRVGRGRAALRMMAEEGSEEEKATGKEAMARKMKDQYWRGEWICVDCGYIYKPGRKIKFEDLPGTWKCPQCNAPKRRFAKKAGDYIAESAGTSNLPIIVFSVIGVLATIAFGIWANNQL